ncbi:putative nitric-oxide reductase domain protein [Burkholderia pseudomallei MSHR7343]|nr:putative nitric-oxide reductase domain protein [Burkholderia pseudomallei MSHR7343]
MPRHSIDDGREQGRQLEHEVERHQQRRDGERHVADEAQPLPQNGRVIELEAARIGEPAIVDRVELRPADRKEVEGDPQNEPRVIQPKRPEAEFLAESRLLGGGMPQAEIDQSDREQAERAEQRRVRVVQREEGAVLVIVDERRVERAAAEHARSDEVPERGAQHIRVRETVAEPLLFPDQAVVLHRVEDEQHERQHLDEREHAADGNPHAGAADPVDVMAGAEHPAQEDQDEFEIHGAFRQLPRHESEPHQQIGADGGREEFEGLLDPEVHDPPAPEVGDREGRVHAEQRNHAERVQQRDIGRGRPDEVLQPDASGPELARRPLERGEAGPQPPQDQRAPEHEADEQADLPEAPQLEVRQPLIAEPEPAVLDHAHDAEIVADQRAGDDHHGGPEQPVDQRPLAARFPAADRGREKQPGADPRQADPYDRRLNVDAAPEIERQHVVEVDAVEARAIGVVVAEDRAGRDLQQQHRRDDQKILADLALAAR